MRELQLPFDLVHQVGCCRCTSKRSAGRQQSLSAQFMLVCCSYLLHKVNAFSALSSSHHHQVRSRSSNDPYSSFFGHCVFKMGYRQQFFVVARVNGVYRTLAVMHHQWLYGRTSLRQLLYTIDILKAPANRPGIRREMSKAGTVCA